jgi:hypothetical protein
MCCVYILKDRLIVANDGQFELHLEGEEVLPHEAGGDEVGAG